MAYISKRKKLCYFCTNSINEINYKDLKTLQRYTADNGKILPRRVTGACAKHQRKVTSAVKRARAVALMPYTRG